MSKSVKVNREEFQGYQAAYKPSRKAVVKVVSIRREARKVKRLDWTGTE